MLERLAVSVGRNDEELNIALAEEIVSGNDSKGVSEIVSGLSMKQAIANDCIKVLYEIGVRKPALIAEHVSSFLGLLKSKNNRLVWGSMTALATIADDKADTIFENLADVKEAYENGSVITRDQSITVLAKVSKAKDTYEKEIFPFLLNHLSTCRPKEVGQHSERAMICVNDGNKDVYREVLESRMEQLTKAQQTRVKKVIRAISE